jgi:hypothetical protein
VIQLSDLPLADELTDDLLKLYRALDQLQRLRLSHIESLPSVAAFKPGQPVADDIHRSLALEFLVSDAIQRYPEGGEKTALEALYTFGEPNTPIGEREENAADALEVASGVSFRRGRNRVLVRSLADEILRYEFYRALSRYETLLNPSMLGASWARMVERDWAVRIDDSGVQHWEFRERLLCVAPVLHPVFICILDWTGTGEHAPETVSVLSGPDPDQPSEGLPHQLLAIRPTEPGATQGAVYIFDLGSPIAADDEVELHFTQRLVDLQGSFVPVIKSHTRHDTIVRHLAFRATLPSGLALNPRGEMAPKRFLPHGDGAVGRQWTPPESVIHIEPDIHGQYSYEISNPSPNHEFALWWGAGDGGRPVSAISH